MFFETRSFLKAASSTTCFSTLIVSLWGTGVGQTVVQYCSYLVCGKRRAAWLLQMGEGVLRASPGDILGRQKRTQLTTWEDLLYQRQQVRVSLSHGVAQMMHQNKGPLWRNPDFLRSWTKYLLSTKTGRHFYMQKCLYLRKKYAGASDLMLESFTADFVFGCSNRKCTFWICVYMLDLTCSLQTSTSITQHLVPV